MEAVYAVAFWALLLVGALWFVLAFAAAGFAVSVAGSAMWHGFPAWRRPGVWGRTAAASFLGGLATLGYGLTSMESFFKLDADDPCTIDDALMDNAPVLGWPLSDVSCGGYESVPVFVNPLICVLALLFCVSTAMAFWRRRVPTGV